MAGIGGGGVTVPLIQALFQFSLKRSIALSGFSIFICSVTRFIVNYKQKHPEKKDCVSLDYSLATVMNPTVLMGSFIGVIFNTWFPDLLIQIILTLLLFFLTTQAGIKARDILRKENRALARKNKSKKNTNA